MSAVVQRDSKELWHGTVGGYGNHGCRCGPCTEANRESMRRYRLAHPEQVDKSRARAQEKRAKAHGYVSWEEWRAARVAAGLKVIVSCPVCAWSVTTYSSWTGKNRLGGYIKHYRATHMPDPVMEKAT